MFFTVKELYSLKARVDAQKGFLYDASGRLAQRLERPVYTRKVVRSNRTLPTSRCLQPGP